MTRSVAVVPHSHWDREWYAPFESYRVRLVSMMDQVVGLLEAEGGYAHFHLDGQVAALEDYLEVRPEMAGRVGRLVASGRLAVGPWYVLMDEFCVSGETIVRNLQKGLRRAAGLGAGPFVGYLPDMFGHIAQMPQLLRLAGIASAVVWRGVPSAVSSRSFWWSAPDGSAVRAEYLPVGYASGAFLPKDPDALLRRLDAHEREILAWLGPDGPMLLLNGGDHQDPQAWLPGLLEEVNAGQDRFRLGVTSLSAFLSGPPPPPVSSWTGELRSGARAPLLMGVLSSRVDIKQAAARAELALEGLAEPMATLWLPPDHWPAALVDRAWDQLILNSAHDSICGCSADAVGRAVLSRFDSALAIAGEVWASARAVAGVATQSPGVVVVNPLAEAQTAVVELVLPGTTAPPGTQPIEVSPAGVVERRGKGGQLARILGELAAEGALGPTGRAQSASLSEPSGPLVVTLVCDPTSADDPAMAPVMAEAWARAGAGRDAPLTVRVESAAWQRVWAVVGPVPGYGWWVWDGRPASAPPVVVEEGDGRVVLNNGLVEATLDTRSGLVDLWDPASGRRARGLNRIVEEGDDGDTYNFSPTDRPAVDVPASVRTEVVAAGPVVARVRVTRDYPWDSPTSVTSVVELRAGERIVRFETGFDHRGQDHRVRALFPLPGPASETLAECAFAAVTRQRAEGGPMEPAAGTFPSRRWVSAGDLTVHHQGLLEYELVEGRALALTLLRATGILSRPAPAARPNVAGPPLPVPDAQLPGPRQACYAVGLASPPGASPWAESARIWNPLQPVPAAGGGPLADRGSRLAVDLGGARVSALHRVAGGEIELRVFNPGDQPATVSVEGQSGRVVDLTGREVERWSGSFAVGPGAIVTTRLDRVDLDQPPLA